MSGLFIGLIVGGGALIAGLIWAVVDNVFFYKRRQPDEAADGDTAPPP